MTAYKLIYLGGRVEYLYARSLEAAEAYARDHYARLESLVQPAGMVQPALVQPVVDAPSA